MKISNIFQLLRCPQVQHKVGFSRSTLYAEIKAGRFPKPIKLTSKRCVGWLAEEVEAYIQARISESRNAMNGGV